jgi:hypothetical protein
LRHVGASGFLSVENEQDGIFWNHLIVPVLANENHERYSRLRAILIPPRAAAKSIGLSPKSGVATKLERNKAIQSRVAELVLLDEEILREKRAHIEATLTAIACGDGSEFPGRLTLPKYPDRLNALNQLRDMHGFKAATKNEHTGANGAPIAIEDISMADRARALVELMNAANKPEAA